MNNIIVKLLGLAIVAILTTSCEDVVTIDVPKNEIKLVVDAQLTDRAGTQTMKLMLSQAYFDNTPPPPATGAVAKVTDNEGREFIFTQRLDENNKPTIFFDWKPKADEVLGKIGNTYNLNVIWDGNTYAAETKVFPSPQIDSIIYVSKDFSNQPGFEGDVKKGFRPEFYARDFKGEGNCYFIKGSTFTKKDKKWNQDNQTIAYDAAFQPGSRADGLVFILPLRRSITNKLLEEGDSVRTEIFSITEKHFEFLRAAQQDAGNQGLFATPPAQIPTNIVDLTSKKKAMGWFSVSAVSKKAVVIDPKLASPDND